MKGFGGDEKTIRSFLNGHFYGSGPKEYILELIDDYSCNANLYEREQCEFSTQDEGLTPFESRREMRDAFWDFYMKYKDNALIIADFETPAESHFLHQCIEDDLENRQWEGPYPLHEVGTMLLAKGLDPDLNRIEFSGYNGVQHNPVEDAIASALTWIKASRI